MDAKKTGYLLGWKQLNIHEYVQMYIQQQKCIWWHNCESQEEYHPWWGLGSAQRAAVVGLFQGVFWNYTSGETAKLGKFLCCTRSHRNLMSLTSAVQFAYWEPPGRQAGKGSAQVSWRGSCENASLERAHAVWEHCQTLSTFFSRKVAFGCSSHF